VRSETAGPDDLPAHIKIQSERATNLEFGETVLPIRELQRRYAAWALQRLGGAKMATCEALGIDSKTLSKWLSEGSGGRSGN
jgi:two-component system response regulator HydG